MGYRDVVQADAPSLYWRLGEAPVPVEAYSTAVLTDAPMAYWPLNETTGTVAHDVTGHGFDGTYPTDGSVIAGGATLLGQPAAQYPDPTVSSPSTLYANTGTGITIDSPGTLPTAPGAGTIEFWIRAELPASVTSPTGIQHTRGGLYMMPLWWGTIDGSEPYIASEVLLLNPSSPDFGGSAALVAPLVYEYNFGGVGPRGAYPHFSDAAWTVGWHHIVLTWDAASTLGHVYLDGGPWTRAGTSFDAFDAQAGAVTYGAIGAGPPGTDGWYECVTGALAHVAFYDHALTATQVATHYEVATGITLVADTSDQGHVGRTFSGVTLGVPGLLRADVNTAAHFNGTDGVIVQDATSTLPAAASVELWLQTTTSAGGVLAQFATADGTHRDLTLAMRNDGTIAFRAGSTEISTPQRNNSGHIRHVVAKLDPEGDMSLWLQGSRAAHATGASLGSSFRGRWQIGGGHTDDLAEQPLSPYFQGTIDEVAIYASYEQQVLADTPLAYWTLSDAASTTTLADASGNARTLSVTQGTVTWGTTSGPVTGDTCAVFTGGELSSSVTTGLPTGASPYTLECWASLGASAVAGLVGYGMETTTNHACGIIEHNSFVGRHSTDNVDFFVGYDFGLSTWNHLVVTYDGSVATWYVDGAAQATKTPWTPAIALATIHLGSWQGSNLLTGKLAHVAIYGHALTAARVLAHYEAA